MSRAAHTPAPSLFLLLSATTVLLIALFLRAHNTLLYPPFIDEAHHILWASDVYTLHPFTGASNGKLLGLWWMSSFGLYGDGALWLARVATGLFGLIGITALYRVGALLASPLLGLLAALAYSLSPFAFFFDRMALVDSYVVVFGILTTLFALLYVRRGRRLDALFCGLALLGAVLAKATGIMLVFIPLLAIVLLSGQWSWARRVTGLAWIYGAFAALWIPFYLLLRWRGYSYFVTATTIVGTSDTSDLLDRLGDNFRNALRIDVAYLGMAFLLLAAACAVYLAVRRTRNGMFVLFAALLPLGGLLAFATRLSSRYLQFHIPFLILLITVGLGALVANLVRTRERRRAILPLLCLILWAGVQAIPFIATYWNNPLDVTLPPFDEVEYVSGDSSGFGLPEVANALRLAAIATNHPIQLIGLISNCEGLRRILPEESNVSVICPYVTLDGGQQANIANRVNTLAAERDRSLWVVLEDNSPYFSLDGITAPLEQIRIVERPGGLTRLSIHRVAR